jgi:hypothetical protein
MIKFVCGLITGLVIGHWSVVHPIVEKLIEKVMQ